MEYRVAFLSLHGCPVARLGEKDTGGMNVYLKETAKQLGKLGIKELNLEINTLGQPESRNKYKLAYE